MKWLVVLAMLGGCLVTPGPEPYGFDYKWQKVWDGATPGAMHGAKVTYAGGSREAFVVYSGRNAANHTVPGKVWQWKDNQWKELCTNPDPELNAFPTPVYLPGFVWVPDTKLLVLAGGSRTTPTQVFGDISDEVWTCDESDTWHKASATLRNARAGASLLYVPDSHELKLVGGRDSTRQFQNVEVADVSATSWNINPEMAMPFYSAGSGQTATYNSNESHVMALESELTPDDSIFPHDSIWSYDGAWHEYCTNCSGIGRSDASIVHVEESEETYVIGGYRGGGNNVSGTWILDSGGLVKVEDDPLTRNAIGVASNSGPSTNWLFSYGGTAPDCPSFECSDAYEYRALMQ